MTEKITILLIDDDEDDRDFFQLALADINNDIGFLSAESGYEAFDLLQNNKLPNYIFLDLNMPGMSGRECLTELKSNHAFKSIPVVIFSTSSDPRDIKETKQLGAIDFITKPSKISDLVNAINNFLSKHLHQTIIS